MNFKSLFITTSALFLFCQAQAQSAAELLKASDRARGSAIGGLTWKSTIETSEDGDSSTREFMVKVKDNDAYVEALQPARNKGEIFIFNDRNMWFFKPSLKRPVSISARQKLTGQAANGDIASTNYARDYTPTLEKTEVLNGEKMHVLLLKAKGENMTYDQIRYWIRDKDKLAVKADFLTAQGKAFKSGTMEYKNTVSVGGQKIPFVSKLIIVDSKFTQNRSIISYGQPRAETHSASLFKVSNLTR